ncbi:MAG: indole-3-glycerol phosphate synthase TrpC [Candidatus Sumerlaeia bacterium]|nr:indole-3-glycerol phosphate synthase TrpC [Candidatus Sumerlaeia bacterium]
MILDEIIANKHREIAERKHCVPLRDIELHFAAVGVPRDLAHALRTPRSRPAVIAECKRASPSRGLIRDPYDPVAIARSYEANGASAISVLTDAKYFGGSLDHLAAVHAAVTLPVLCKDFILDEYQIFAARAAGADAVLLIAAVLDDARMRDLIEVVWALRMHALVEVHDAAEIERAAESNTGIIGINNRNLDTLEVDLRQTERLLPLLPDNVLVVSESGIRSADDLRYLAGLGVHGVLIGEHFMSAPDPGTALAMLIGG